MGLLDQLFANMPQSASYASADPSSMLGSYAPPVDPFAEEDAAAALKKARTLQKQAPVPFAGMLASSGILGAPGAGPQEPDLPPATNDPAAREPVVMTDDVPLERPRPTESINGQPIANSGAEPDMGGAPMSLAPVTDLSARSGAQPAAAEEPSFGKKLFNLADNILSPRHAGTLLALGAGFAGAPSFGAGMSRAFSAAAPAVAADRAYGTQQDSVAATYRALVAKGVPPAEALAASQNKDIMKAVAGKYFEAKPLTAHKIGTDMMSNDIMGSFNPNTGKYYDTAGREIGAGGGDAAAGNGSGMQVLAKGVKSYDNTLPADGYLEQFGPEVQAAIKNYAAGKTLPTGNPRLKALGTNIKTWAQTWGEKGGNDGMPVDDTTFRARSTMRNDLSKNSTSGLGGQINFGNTAIDHLHDLSKKAIDLGNWDVGLAGPSRMINEVRGMSSAQAAKMDALKGAAQHYGQEITKFYAGSPGGEAERNRFMESVNGAKTPQQLAAVIETETQLMHGRMRQLESQIGGTLGAEGLKQYPAIRPESEKALSGIASNVQQLRTGQAPAVQSAAPAVPGAGRDALLAEARRRGLVQ